MQAEIIFESGVNAGQHLDVGAGGEELVTRAREHNHIHAVVHAGLQDGVIELPVHLVGIGIGGWIAHLDHCDACVGAVFD
jgi:hypothetical protein